MRFWFLIAFSCMCFSQENIKISDLQNNNDFAGQIKRIENFPSKYVASRTVDIWLPINYSETKKYQVLYMHDGQMLFDAKTTWNKQEWGVDEKMDSLAQKKAIKEVIVVAVWNIPTIRHLNYFPQKAIDFLSDSDKKFVIDEAKKINLDLTQISSDNYLKFLVSEVKPFIDSHFSVYTDKENTAIMGSSMGGLIAMYAVCEYPEVFGGAACMSTHWVGTFSPENNPIPKAFADYMRVNLPAAKTHKMYFDHGTLTLDALYGPFQKEIDAVMKEKGYDETLWKTLVFDGAEHTEQDWFKRLDVPLLFLLGF